MVGGVETHLDDLCNFFNKQKHTVYVRTYKALGANSRGQTNEKNGYINIHRLWWPNFGLIFKLEIFPTLKFFYIFSGLFFDCLFFLLKNSKKIDVIQAHGFIAALIAVILGKMFNKKVIINTHVGFNLKQNFMTKVLKWTLLNSQEILVLTAGIKKSLIKIGVPEEKLTVYHYWVDQQVFSPVKDAKKEVGWEDKFVVLFVGRLIGIKGVMKIFNLADKLKSVTFAVIGSGPLSDELKQKAENNSNVQFLGKVNNKDLPIYYSASDLLLIPSKVIKQEYEEGIPRVMIEALSCGLPVVATRSGGIPDVFSDKIGMLVADNNRQMESAIKKLYKNKSLLNLMVSSCRRFALDAFSMQNAQIIEKSLYE